MNNIWKGFSRHFVRRCTYSRYIQFQGFCDSNSSTPIPPTFNHGTFKKIVSKQPTHFSHPHLLQRDEVTVGITFSEYKQRREKVMSMLQQNEGTHHILVIMGVPRRYMVEKIPYNFRQATDMFWLSGCLEEDCVLVVHTEKGAENCRSVMFCPEISPNDQLWDGPRTHHLSAPAVWGVDEGLPISHLTQYLSEAVARLGAPTIWYPHRRSCHPSHDSILNKWLLDGRTAGLECPIATLHRARVVKSPAEVKLMRSAAKISADAISRTMSWARPGMSEHDLFAKVDFETRVMGASRLAYPPVVAGGPRANIIHYITNNQIIQPGQMVLMDAGAEVNGYSGDVTRTWPIDGKFSGPQRELYEACLLVQQSVVAALNESRHSVDDLYKIMIREMIKVMDELGFFERVHFLNKMEVARKLCPHHVSHYLGCDVHDTSYASRRSVLQPNMVITIEPGFYVPVGSEFPSRYHGLGIRIEDDVLITDAGCDVLTGNCPKHPDDIEKLISAG